MNEAVFVLLNYFLVFVESISLVFFCEGFFAKRVTTRKFVLSVLKLTIFNFIGLAISDWNTLVKVVLLAGIDAIWIHKVFSVSIIKSVVTPTMFVSIISIADNIFMMGTSFVSKVNIQSLLQDPYVYYLFCYFAKCFELLAIVILRLFAKQYLRFENTTWQNWGRVFIFPVASLVIAVFLWRIYWSAPFAAKELMSCTMVLLIIDMFIIAFLNYLNQQEQIRQDNVILQHNIKFQNEMISTWEDAYKSQRKMTHDFQNQLSVIYGLAEREAPESELLSYVQTLLKINTTSSLLVKTGRQVADVLFSQKYNMAQKKNIQFCMQLDDLTNFTIDDAYLVVLLSNLIDNAIEACEKIPDVKLRKIVVKMRVENEESFLYIENTTSAPVKILDDQVVVSDKNSIEHGYGLRTVANILNQYNAVFAISYRNEDRTFCFSAQIPPASK